MNRNLKKDLILILIGILCLLFPKAKAQQKVFTKKDIAPIVLTAAAGYAQGWRDHVLYHPNQLRVHNLQVA